MQKSSLPLLLIDPTHAADVFLPQHRTQLLRVVPVREGHTVEWAWQTRPSIPLYRASPLNYLSHLLGHEGRLLCG
jgi:hypothetical protein